MSEIQVPPWAARARQLFRLLIGLWALLWLIGFVLNLVDLIFSIGLARDRPEWLSVVSHSLLGMWLICGLVWMAGAVVAGYREPKASKN